MLKRFSIVFIFLSVFFILFPLNTTQAACCGIDKGKGDQCTADCIEAKDEVACNKAKPNYTFYTEDPTEVKKRLQKLGCDEGVKSGPLASLSIGCTAYGNCTVCDFIKVFTNVARMILGAAGAFALFFFILGGFMMVISQGNKDKVQKGKDILKSTLIGILIVLGAWQIIRVTLMVLTQPKDIDKEIITIFKDPTYNPCEKGKLPFEDQEKKPADPPKNEKK